MKWQWLVAAGGAALVLGGTRVAQASGPGLSTAYDTIFRRRCPGIPVEYLRALAKRESDMNPVERNPGEGWGLLQVVEDVRVSYNRRFETGFTQTQLLDPDVNARIACELIGRIAGLYGSWYQRAFPGGFNWYDLRHAGLVTYGWNAGWSPERGVGRVIRQLLADGHAGADVTVDAVYSRAQTMSEVASTVKNRKTGWIKSVLVLYVQEQRRPAV